MINRIRAIIALPMVCIGLGILWLAEKIAGMPLFEDTLQKMERISKK